MAEDGQEYGRNPRRVEYNDHGMTWRKGAESTSRLSVAQWADRRGSPEERESSCPLYSYDEGREFRISSNEHQHPASTDYTSI